MMPEVITFCGLVVELHMHTNTMLCILVVVHYQ